MSVANPDEKAIFNAARRIESPEARRLYVTQACGDDRTLCERIEALLRVHDEDATFLRPPAEQLRAGPEPAPAEAPGTVIGPYTLQRQLGQGGMGVVFLAEQAVPVRRQVALKIIRPGMDSRQVLARFEAERQTLALMDHPNIAKILDAGTTPAGRSYFVMELVPGVPITDYCDEHRLTPRQRLELFVPVCQGVQHAHQKGVIHRDLKPSNVLVPLYDGRAVPKIIDFGLAKATGPGRAEAALATQFGTIIGTPQYMSPEQAGLNQLDIDTRSDVYALGVLLYELLTGTTPLQPERNEPLLELLRRIREAEPPRPSTRLDTADGLASVAAARGTEPKKLRGLVRGELDWIVMKALEKDRNRRYDTAGALARDVQRYLADEPVEASPPGAGYRLRKFARRHRTALATATAFGLLLLAGVTVSVWQAVRATAAETKAVRDRDDKEAARQAEADQRERADEEAAITQAVNDFLQKDLLGQADIANQAPGSDRNKNITVRELLDRAAQGLDARFPGKERTEAAIRLTLGRPYRALGEYPEAQKHLERSLALREEKLGAGHADTLESMRALAGLHTECWEYDEAERLYKQALEARGEDHPDSLPFLNDLGMLYCQRSRFDEAESLLRRALEARRARLGDDHLDTLESMSGLALLHSSRHRYDLAEPLYRQTLEARRLRQGDDHPATLLSMYSLADVCRAQKRYGEAEPLFDRALALQRARLGPDHSNTLTTMHGLALLYQQCERFDEAEAMYRDILKARSARQGPDHPDTLESMNNLGFYYWQRDRYDDAVRLFKQVLASQRANPSLGPSHADTITSMANLAVLYRELGRYDDAEPLFREAVAGAKKTFGLGHPNTHTVIDHLADLYALRGTPHLAEPLLRELVAFLRDQPEPASTQYASQLGQLAQNLLHQKKYAEAEPFARDSLAIRARNKPDGWTTHYTRSLLGAALLGQKKYADAEPLLVEGYAGMKAGKVPKGGKVYVTQALGWLVQLHDARGNKAEADRLRKELEDEKTGQKK
jgi:serine/threonine protein kinase/tetratricopeptide (TPR) repeat protein